MQIFEHNLKKILSSSYRWNITSTFQPTFVDSNQFKTSTIKANNITKQIKFSNKVVLETSVQKLWHVSNDLSLNWKFRIILLSAVVHEIANCGRKRYESKIACYA